jgi:hypothetical protein
MNVSHARSYLLLAIAEGASIYPEGAESLLAEYDALKRTEVLHEAAVVALNLRQFEKASGARAGAQVSENVGIVRVADELMRLADGGESRG